MQENKIQMRKKATYDVGVVACPKCASPVHIYKFGLLADEFSVRVRNAETAGYIQAAN